MRTVVYTPDIECDSCERLLRKAFARHRGVASFAVSTDTVTIDHDERTSADSLVDIIKSNGFRASLDPYDRPSFSERWRDFRSDKKKYVLERQVITRGAIIFLTLTVIQALAYLAGLRMIDGFVSQYGWWLLYLNLSVATLSVATWHFLAYRAKVTCMVGMMIGMTFGMQTGMMLGAVLGATNGFFVGAMAGMLLGSAIGAITGRCCGVMGVMEGMMAGLMGGTMGAMVTVMMLSDHILWFMPFYMAINVAILWGLSYMLFEEVVEGKIGVVRRPASLTTVTAAAILLGTLLMTLMIWGPKAAFFA